MQPSASLVVFYPILTDRTQHLFFNPKALGWNLGQDTNRPLKFAWLPKARYTLSVKLSDFTVWRHTWRKNWVNCAVLKAIAQASELSFPVVFHTENWEVHSGNTTVSSLHLPKPRWHHLEAHLVSSNAFSRWTSHDIILFKCHFLLHILRFLFFFSDNIMAGVASKQQMTALFLSITVTHTRRHTELTNVMGNLCCAREHSVQFFVQFFLTQLNCPV